MQKELIKNRFTKSLKTYNKYAVAQKIMAKKLAEYIPERKYNSILELGCGTGLLTKEINQRLEFEQYDAVDIVGDCIEYITPISEKINFICDDIECFSTDKKYDLIISNAAIQWIENVPFFVDKMAAYLNKRGVFAFTLFGEKNYKELRFLKENRMKYYKKEELEQSLNKYNLYYLEEDEIVLEFNNPKEVLYHMKNTGVNALSQTRWTRADMIDFLANYNLMTGGKNTLTYNPIYVSISN